MNTSHVGMDARGYRVGLATVDITPPVGVSLAGFSSRTQPSDGIYHPLRATVIAIDDGHVAVVVVSIEWLGFYNRTVEARRRIAARTGLPPERILLTGTHTHCGPGMRELDVVRHGAVDEAYIDRALDAIADAAGEAWADRQAASLAYAVGRSDLAVSRRRPNDQGGVDWGPAPDEPSDHQISLLTVRGAEGELRALLMGYACHPTSTSVNQIGGDYVGFALDAIAARLGGVTVAFFNGCAGDQKPHVPSESGGFRSLDVPEVRALGERFAGDVLASFDEASFAPVTGQLGMGRTVVTLKTEPVDVAAAMEARASDHDWLRRWGEALVDEQGTARPVSREVPLEVDVLTFGHALAWVAFAGEMVVEYALRLKPELEASFDHAWVSGYANDIMGYVPVRRQIPRGGYEVEANNRWYLRPGRYVDETEDMICQATVELARRCAATAAPETPKA